MLHKIGNRLHVNPNQIRRLFLSKKEPLKAIMATHSPWLWNNQYKKIHSTGIQPINQSTIGLPITRIHCRANFTSDTKRFEAWETLAITHFKRVEKTIINHKELEPKTLEVYQKLDGEEVQGRLTLVRRDPLFRINPHYFKLQTKQQSWAKSNENGLVFNRTLPVAQLSLTQEMQESLSEIIDPNNQEITIPELMLVNPQLLAALTGSQLEKNSFHYYSDLISWLYMVDDLVVDTDILVTFNQTFFKYPSNPSGNKQSKEAICEEASNNILKNIMQLKLIQYYLDEIFSGTLDLVQSNKASTEHVIQSFWMNLQTSAHEQYWSAEWVQNKQTNLTLDETNIQPIVCIFQDFWRELQIEATKESWSTNQLQSEIVAYLNHANHELMGALKQVNSVSIDEQNELISPYPSIESYLKTRPLGGGIRVVLEYLLMTFPNIDREFISEIMNAVEGFIGVSNDVMSLEKEWDQLDTDNAAIIRFILADDQTSNAIKIYFETIDQLNDHTELNNEQLTHLRYSIQLLMIEQLFGRYAYKKELWSDVFSETVDQTNQFVKLLQKKVDEFKYRYSEEHEYNLCLSMFIDWVNGYSLFEKCSGRHKIGKGIQSTFEKETLLWKSYLNDSKIQQRILINIEPEPWKENPKTKLDLSFLKLPKHPNALQWLFDQIPAPETIDTIDLTGTSINALPNLSRFSNLKHLKCAITPIKEIPHYLKDLKSLDISFCIHIDENQLPEFSNLHQLKMVGLTLDGMDSEKYHIGELISHKQQKSKQTTVKNSNEISIDLIHPLLRLKAAFPKMISHNKIGFHFFMNNQIDQSISHLREALSLHQNLKQQLTQPKTNQALITINLEQQKALALLASAYAQKGDHEQAINTFAKLDMNSLRIPAKARQRYPNHFRSSTSELRAFWRLPESLSKDEHKFIQQEQLCDLATHAKIRGESEESIKLLKELLHDHIHYLQPASLIHILRFQATLIDTNVRLAMIEKTLPSANLNEKILILALNEFISNNATKIETLLDQLPNTHPYRGLCHYYLGVLTKSQYHYESAIKILNSDPKNYLPEILDSLCQQALIYLDIEHPTQANKYIQQGQKLIDSWLTDTHDSAQIIYCLDGISRYISNDIDGATACFEKIDSISMDENIWPKVRSLFNISQKKKHIECVKALSKLYCNHLKASEKTTDDLVQYSNEILNYIEWCKLNQIELKEWIDLLDQTMAEVYFEIIEEKSQKTRLNHTLMKLFEKKMKSFAIKKEFLEAVIFTEYFEQFLMGKIKLTDTELGKLYFSIGTTLVDYSQSEKSIDYLKKCYRALEGSDQYMMIVPTCYHIAQQLYSNGNEDQINEAKEWVERFQQTLDILIKDHPEQISLFTNIHYFDISTNSDTLGISDIGGIMSDLMHYSYKNKHYELTKDLALLFRHRCSEEIYKSSYKLDCDILHLLITIHNLEKNIGLYQFKNQADKIFLKSLYSEVQTFKEMVKKESSNLQHLKDAEKVLMELMKK